MTQPTHTDLFASPSSRLTLLAFAIFGALFGVWQVLVADLQLELDLSPGEFGFAITIGFLASFPVMIFGGRLVDRLGVRLLLIGTTLGMGIAFAGLSIGGSYLFLIVLMLFFFGSSGGYDVAINAAAVHVEQGSERPILPYFHAAFSAAAAIMALSTGIMLYLEVSFRLLFLMVAFLLFSFVWVVWRSRTMRQMGLSPQTETGTRSSAPLPYRPVIILLSIIALCVFLTEGALETWSATYLRLVLVLPPVLGAAAPATFHLAMMMGRLMSGRVIHRLSRYRFLQLAGGLAALGLLIALATTAVPLILLGILVAGLSLAGVVPVVFSLAGQLAPNHVGRASALITTVGYCGFLIGPSLIGGLADLFSLRGALALLIGLSALILPLSSYAKIRTRHDNFETIF